MPRLRLVGDTGRNSDVIPFPSDRVRRGTRPGDSARLVEPTPSRGRTESIRQVEKAMTDVQQNLDELAGPARPLRSFRPSQAG